MKKFLILLTLLVSLGSCGTMIVDDEATTTEVIVQYGTPYYYQNRLVYYYYGGYYYYPYGSTMHRYSRPIKPWPGRPMYNRHHHNKPPMRSSNRPRRH